MVTSKTKKEVVKNWHHEFQSLSIYAQNKLYRLYGAFVIGLEILNIPRTEFYKPVFVCYPFWEKGVVKCLEEPIFTQEILNKKGLQYSIPYNDLGSAFVESVESAKKQVPILFQQTFYAGQFIEVVNNQLSQLLVKASPVAQAKLFEAKLLGALYVNDISLVNKILEDINIASVNWLPNLFEWKYGEVDKWIDRLRKIVDNNEQLLAQIGANREEAKLK